MGATRCLFWEMSPERLPNDGRRGGIRASVMELMKKRWRRRMKLLEQQQQQQQPGLKQMIGKLQRLRTQRQMEKTRQPTLEEWFLASPGLNNGCCSSGSTRGSGEGLCLGVEKEKQGKAQRGKGKKKVSFRLPGLAQIIVFDSADEMAVKKVNSTVLPHHNWVKTHVKKRDDAV